MVVNSVFIEFIFICRSSTSGFLKLQDGRSKRVNWSLFMSCLWGTQIWPNACFSANFSTFLKSLTTGRERVFASVKFQLNVCFLHNFVKIGILSTFLEIPAQPLFYRKIQWISRSSTSGCYNFYFHVEPIQMMCPHFVCIRIDFLFLRQV